MDLVLLNIYLSIYTHIHTYKRKQMKILSFLNLYVINYMAIDWQSNFMWNSYWRIKIFGCCKLQYVLNFLFTVLADFLLVFDHCDGKWIIWRWKYMREGERERGKETGERQAADGKDQFGQISPHLFKICKIFYLILSLCFQLWRTVG